MIRERSQQQSSAARTVRRLEPWQVVEIAIALHLVAIVVLLLFVRGDFNLGTVDLYMGYGEKLLQGAVPYRDFTLEYPPLATVLFAVPMLLGRTPEAFQTFFALQMIVFDLVITVVAFLALQRLAPGAGPWGVLLAQPLLLVMAGKAIVLTRFDLAPAALTLLAMVLWSARRERLGWLVLGVATALKLYPILIAPLLVLFGWKRRPVRALALDLALFAAATLIPTLLVTRGDLSFVTGFVAYHKDRGLEIESLYSSLLMVGGLLTGSPLAHVYQFGSEELIAPLVPWALELAFPLTALSLLAVYLLAWQVARRPEQDDPFNTLITFSVAALLCFMVFGKVLSPQYLLWLYPFAGVVVKRRELMWVWLGSAFLLTLWVFPYHWFDLTAFSPLTVAILFLRNVELAVLAVLILLPYVRKPLAAR